MKKNKFTGNILQACFLVFGVAVCMPGLHAQKTSLTLDLSKPGAAVSPMLYGLMTEEINHSYDGGLYGELIRNRIFKDNKTTPEGWSLVKDNAADSAAIKLMAASEEHIPYDERNHAINGALSTCLRLTVEKTSGRVGISNEGYWGIPVKPAASYRASFYIKGTAAQSLFAGHGSQNPLRLHFRILKITRQAQ